MARRITAKWLNSLTTTSNSAVENGFVEFEDDGTIIRTGKCDNIEAEENFFDGVVCPGFVNAHNHVELSFMKGKMPKGTGMAKFVDIITAVRDNTPVDEKKRLVKYWMDRMWDEGVSAMGDISNDHNSFEIKAKHPMYTRTFLEIFDTEPENVDRLMRQVLELKAEADALGLDAAPTPHACYSMSPELLTACSVEGLKSGYLSFHCEESDQEEEMLMNGSGPMWETRKRDHMSTPPVVPGRTALEYFIERVGAGMDLPVEGNMLLVHECCMTEEGAKAAAKAFKHLYVALCPLSNIYIHDNLPPVREMRNWPVTLTVGTDSLSSNDTLCMVDELFCLQSRFNLELGELLRWTCLNGARLLGKDDLLGSIEPGKKPGLVFIANVDAAGQLTKDSFSKRII